MSVAHGTQFDLSGKVAIVTGGTKGMGLAIVRRFARHGAKVAVSSRTQTDCDAVAQELNAELGSGTAIGVAADLLDIPSLQRLVDRTAEAFGGVNIVVCNAALQSFGKEGEISDDEWSDVILGNTRSNFRLCERALPHMRKAGGGSIILVGSQGAGLRPSASMAVYAISKRAVVQLAENMALYLGPENIRVNVIAPGFIRTALGKALWGNPRLLKTASDCIALRRVGECDEIAGAALFLASNAGGYTTGVTIPVDGGQNLMGTIGDALKVDEVFTTYSRFGVAS